MRSRYLLLAILATTLVSGCADATAADDDEEELNGTFSAQLTGGIVPTLQGIAYVHRFCAAPWRSWSFTFKDEARDIDLSAIVTVLTNKTLTTRAYPAGPFPDDTTTVVGFDRGDGSNHATARSGTFSVDAITNERISGRFSLTMVNSNGATFGLAGQYDAPVRVTGQEACT